MKFENPGSQKTGQADLLGEKVEIISHDEGDHSADRVSGVKKRKAGVK